MYLIIFRADVKTQYYNQQRTSFLFADERRRSLEKKVGSEMQCYRHKGRSVEHSLQFPLKLDESRTAK